MSVEKLNSKSKTEIESKPYTQISNFVITNIKDNDAFRIWSFLSSKSMDWEIVKEWTAKKCGVSARKAIKVWSYLNRCGLLECKPIKDEQNKITHWDLVILSGEKFNPDILFIDSESAQSKLQKEIKKARGAKMTPVGKSQRCRNALSGESTPVENAPLLNKEKKQIKIQIKKQREANSLLSSDFEPNQEAFVLMQELNFTQDKAKLCFQKFKEYYQDKKATDWHTKFKMWLLNEKVRS